MNKISLKDVSELITKGTTPSSVGCEFTSEGINFIKSESIADSKFLNNNLYAHIDETTDEKLKRSRLKAGDLLVSIAGAYLGKIAIVLEKDIPANTNQAVGIVRLNKKLVDIDYVYYYFSQKHINSYINKLSAQSSQPNLNLDLLGKLEFEFRDLTTQKKIASVLSTLDAKMELNNRINEELEDMAKSLYDYWFVQFDFPDANGKPYKASGGKLVWNEELKREVPEGWEYRALGEMASIKAGGDKPENYSIEKTDLLNVPIYSNGINNDGLYGYTNKSIIDEQCITISARGTIGFCVLRNKPFVPIIRLITLIPKIKGNVKYFYETLRQITFENSGSVQQQLTVPQVMNIKILCPNDNILKMYDNVTGPIIKKIEIIKDENQKLTELRDWLLPMLMNGQVKVGDGEDEVLSMAADGQASYKQ